MSYWRKREQEHIKKSVKDDAAIAKIMKKNQINTMKDIQLQIDAFYGKYATVEGISMSEARKMASRLDVKEYGEKAKKYVKYAHSDNPTIQAIAFTENANLEMRAYNLTLKVNRLELLKANIDLEVIKMTSAEEHFLTEKFTAGARSEYKRQSGILGESLIYNEKNFKHIVGASFHGATWSERLWVNQQALRSELNTLLNRGIIQGKNPRVLARDLRKKFDASVADSERLMRTELSRIQTEIQQDAFKQLGIDKLEWVAEPDACKICQGLDGQVHSTEEWEGLGVENPAHPNCRCSFAPVADREAFERDLDSRGL